MGFLEAAERRHSIVPPVLSPLPYFPIHRMSFYRFLVPTGHHQGCLDNSNHNTRHVKHRKRSTLRVANCPSAIRDGSHMRLVSKSSPRLPSEKREREKEKTKEPYLGEGRALEK
ncbi:uncharacterized protein TrAtP1_006387 [Trichoderma atroviride]|uniref:uncharacterized protein n=1 Tax=Hypocrea atroviridis TaxID=63577 RepID=UPI003326460F|nr:hypothetical protein TrAtP1_006387 [Trichoderma atroviride]